VSPAGADHLLGSGLVGDVEAAATEAFDLGDCGVRSLVIARTRAVRHCAPSDADGQRERADLEAAGDESITP
jgi:hypothetical protein